MKNTVQDLIDALMKIEDKTQLVSMEGCDCNGDWGGEIGQLEWEDYKAIELKR